MSRFVGAFQSVRGHMRVNFSGTQPSMPQQLLNASEISPAIEQVGRKTVSQLVWRDICCQSAGGQMALQPTLHGYWPNGIGNSRTRKEKRPIAQPGMLYGCPIESQSVDGRLADRKQAFLAPLPANSNFSVGHVQVLYMKSAYLADSQASRVDKFKQRRIAQTVSISRRCADSRSSNR